MASSSVASSASFACVSTIPTGTGRANLGDRSADPVLQRQSLVRLADRLWVFWQLPGLSTRGLCFSKDEGHQPKGFRLCLSGNEGHAVTLEFGLAEASPLET